MSHNAQYVWPSSDRRYRTKRVVLTLATRRGCLSMDIIASVQHFRRLYGLAMNNAFTPKRRNNTGTESNQVKRLHVGASRQRGGGKQPDVVGRLSLGVIKCVYRRCTGNPRTASIMHIKTNGVTP